ncbi:ABC transporter permease [Nocardia blacklockiae]|uniref:ABC transporter permease n=1 Tax=Nocardia blacklockiae TaxID=480036 RepID=UPI0018942634|nr:ABC transporter permease [Nocardia blacklockiae]MBF6169943.1 ABC transporter permease [Nocardia blacklockiae]
MTHLDLLLSADILAATVRSGIPLLLLGLGGLLCHQAGVFNVALEGLLLIGCFAAVAGSALSGSAAVGVAAAVAAGVLTAFVLSVGTVARHGNPLILGTAVNIVAAGLTTFALQALFHVRGTYHRPDLARLPHWFAPAEHALPWVGPILAALSPLGLLALAAVPATAIFLRHTVAGTRLRGVGMHAEAAQSLGVRPDRYRAAALLVSGALGGLAGAELSLGSVALFTENMSAGRGWIIVLVLLLTGGRLRPMLGTLAVYAYTQSLGFRLQTFGLPMQFGDAAPYLATLVVLVVVGVRARRRAGRAAV